MRGKRVGMIVSSILFALALTGLLLAIMAVEARNDDPSREGPDVVPGLLDALGKGSAVVEGRITSDAKIAARTSLSPSLLVDDFHDEDPRNELGGPSGTYTHAGAMITCTYPGGMLCCDYDVSPESSFALYRTQLLGMSLAGFNSLSFQVKGDVEGELAQAELTPCATCYPKLRIEDYTAEPITATWQRVAMPLVGFTEIDNDNWGCMDQLGIVLANAGGDGRGTICLDNIWLKPMWVPIVVDGFSDCQDPNALGGEHGTWTEGGGTMGYGYTDTVRRGDVGCALWITYAIPSSESWAVWKTELKEKPDASLDASEYEALEFYIKGSQGGEKPNVWLDSAVGREVYTGVTVITTTADDDWQRVVIPLRHFSTQGEGVSLANLTTFQLGFEWKDMEGTVYLDDIRFIPHNIYLPIVLKNHRTWDAYYEENDQCPAAYGTLVSGQTYRAYPDDADDYYHFVLSAPATVSVNVTDFAPTSTWGDLLLYGPATGDECGELIGHFGVPGHSSMSLGPYLLESGKYHVRVYTAKDHSTTQLYSLMVTY